MKSFEFLLPNGEKYKIEYDDDSNKIEIVEDIIKYWRDYINECWMYIGKINPYKLNHEDRVKMTLNALAAFLDDSLIIEQWNRKEFPYDYIKNKENHKIHYDTNDILLGIQKDKETYDLGNKRNIKRYKKTQMYKYNHIFTKEDVVVKEVYKLKNRDVYEPEQYEYLKVKFNLINEEEFKKWLQKPFKNLYNQNVFDIREKIYKGWQGIINKKKSYISKWCYVWSDGSFEFNKKQYKIDINKVPQYKDINKDKYYKNETGWSMDNIFCIEQNNKVYFWDMNIDRINSKYIKQI